MNVRHDFRIATAEIPYKHATVEKSISNYGKWLVKTSDVTFRFFRLKRDAVAYAHVFNANRPTPAV